MGSHYYINVSIRSNQFSMVEDWLTREQKEKLYPKGESFAYTTLLAIERILNEDLKEMCRDRDSYTLRKRLKDRAKIIRDGYMQKTAALPFFTRLFGGISKEEEKIQKLYSRIESWKMPRKVYNISFNPPPFIPPSADGKTRVLDLYNDPIQRLQNFLPAEGIRALAQVNKHGREQAIQGEIALAKEYGYQGKDIGGAKKHLNEFFQGIKLLYYYDLIPSKYVVDKNWHSMDPEATLRKIRNLDQPEKDQLKKTFNERAWRYVYFSSNTNDIVLKTLIRLGIDLETKDWKGRTLLALAAEQGNVGAVKILIAAGADLNAKNPAGDTPLLLTINGEFQKRNLWGGNFGWRAYKDIAYALVKAGADVNQPNSNGETPLINAISLLKSKTLIQLFLAKGAYQTINHMTLPGYNALYYAICECRDPKLVKLLLYYGADKSTSIQFRTPIQWAKEIFWIFWFRRKAILKLLNSDQRTLFGPKTTKEEPGGIVHDYSDDLSLLHTTPLELSDKFPYKPQFYYPPPKKPSSAYWIDGQTLPELSDELTHDSPLQDRVRDINILIRRRIPTRILQPKNQVNA
jgi:ankyrin repeat protein